MFSKKYFKASHIQDTFKKLTVSKRLALKRYKNLELLKKINFVLTKLNAPAFKSYTRNSYIVGIEFYHL